MERDGGHSQRERESAERTLIDSFLLDISDAMILGKLLGSGDDPLPGTV